MDPAEDDDIKLIRASASLLTDLKSLLRRILWKRSDIGLPVVHRNLRRRDLDTAIAKVQALLAYLRVFTHIYA